MAGFLPQLHIRQDFVRLGAAHPVRIHSDFAQRDFPAHDHEFAEICLIHGGKGLHVTDEGEDPLSAGSVIVVMPGQVHAFRNTRGLRITNVYYLSEWMMGDFRLYADVGSVFPLFLHEGIFRRPAWRKISHFSLSLPECETARSDLEEMAGELERPTPSHFFLRASFSRFLYRLAIAFDRSGVQAAWKVPSDIERVLGGVEDSVSRRLPFSLVPILEALKISERHLARRFRSVVGAGIWEYYQRRRIQMACHLLLGAERSITEIAYDLGFSDGAHFSRAFRAEKGISPRAYRKIFVESPRL